LRQPRFGSTRDVGLNDATRALVKVFGEEFFNFFYDHRRRCYFAGKFLRRSDAWEKDEHGQHILDNEGKPRPRRPWHREQELYGQGETVEECLRFLRGPRPTLVGYRATFRKDGSVGTLRTRAGLLVGRIPTPPADEDS
jgi:hypothetical protein